MSSLIDDRRKDYQPTSSRNHGHRGFARLMVVVGRWWCELLDSEYQPYTLSCLLSHPPHLPSNLKPQCWAFSGLVAVPNLVWSCQLQECLDYKSVMTLHRYSYSSSEVIKSVNTLLYVKCRHNMPLWSRKANGKHPWMISHGHFWHHARTVWLANYCKHPWIARTFPQKKYE